MEISTALLNTQSPDFTTRQQAETFLHNALEAHMGSFMITLVQALSSEEFPVIGRQAAGLYLKNVLAAKDEVIQQQKIQQWTNLPTEIRLQIKEGVIHVLQSSDATARHTSAQVIAKIGSIELPLQQWPTLLDQLLGNVTNGSDGTIHATLECLGFLCEELMEDCLEETDTNRILTAIVDGMRSDRPLPIQYVATQALRNSLEFISTNFTRPTERDHIMQKVCEATQSNDLRTRVVAFECISVIITCYYEYLSNYMDTICQLTFAAITKDQSEVSLQALEVWSSMCDVEMELVEELEYNSNSTCFYYVKTVLPTLIPLLTQVLTQQEEDQDEDSWNVSMAAATCLALVAQTVGDEVVPLTMAFITSHINSNDWRSKEAAIMAFGSILDGPNTATIAPLVQQALSFLMNCMNFDHLLVRDTTAWTLGRICELHVSCIDATTLDPMMCLLLKGLSQEPRVSHNICYAIHHIVKAFEEHQIELLLPYFNTIFDQLLATAARKDAQESHLIDASYEALSMLIEVSSKEMESHLLLRLPVLLERLETSFQLETTEDIGNVQALLCGVLVASIQKLNEAIIPYSDRIMQALLAVFASRHVTAAEEAFQAVGALANALNEGFLPYMDYIMPLLITGLQNSEEYMVCTAAVGVVGDLCRALEKHILCHCDVLMSTLMDILKNPNLNRSVKPPVLACFGDIALAIGSEMERYLNPCMQMIIQAATACALIEGEEEEEMMEYMNQLRESVLEALTGITQGLHGSSEGNNNKARLLLEYAQPMATFLMTIAKDTQRFEAVTKGAVGLLGDMGQALGMEVAVLAKQAFVHQLISECSQLEDGRETAMWATSVLRPLCM